VKGLTILFHYVLQKQNHYFWRNILNYMSKLLSTNYSTGAFNMGALILRLATGGLLIAHGYQKLMHFSTMKGSFMNFMGIGSTASLSLVIFAEVFCALFVLLGLVTRLACIPPIIAMSVALFKAHHGEVFGKGEASTLFLAGFLVILIIGPGRVSVDGATGN
jgi:putative oxidoreductase